MSELHDKAEAGGRNWYFQGSHDAEEPEDVAARLALVAERDALLAENERLKSELSAQVQCTVSELTKRQGAEARYAALCAAEPVAVVDREAVGRVFWLSIIPDGTQLIPRPSMEGKTNG